MALDLTLPESQEMLATIIKLLITALVGGVATLLIGLIYGGSDGKTLRNFFYAGASSAFLGFSIIVLFAMGREVLAEDILLPFGLPMLPLYLLWQYECASLLTFSTRQERYKSRKFRLYTILGIILVLIAFVFGSSIRGWQNQFSTPEGVIIESEIISAEE